MTTIVEESWYQRNVRRLAEDLKPFPGRTYQALSIAAICAISSAFAMMYQIPEAAIGCYLIIYLMKPDGAENVITGVGVLIAVTLVVALLIVIINLTIDYPPARVAAIVLVSFVFLYLDSASKLGEFAGIFALIIAFVLTLLGYIPFGEIATRAVLYAWAMVAIPMAVIIAYNLFFGVWPQKLLRQTFVMRLTTAADYLASSDDKSEEKLVEMVGQGLDEQNKQLLFVKILHLLPNAKAELLNRAQLHSYRLLLAVSACADKMSGEQRVVYASLCRKIAEKIALQKTPGPIDTNGLDITSPDNDEIAQVLNAIINAHPVEKGAPVDSPFIAKDVFSNPIHLHFALKTTLAAFSCYFIYTAADWQGIHTAMVTCYVAALGTTGDTVHKLVLRITGCLIGAFFGLISIIYLIPHMESVGSLAWLIFFVMSIAAWVSTGSERISYGGVQIGLAFLLTVLQGFEPATSLSAASDRIIGILLGNIVIYIIFTNIWPVSVTYAVKSNMADALSKLQLLTKLDFPQRSASTELVAALQGNLAEVRNELDMASYEPHYLRPQKDMRGALDSLTTEFNQLALKLYFQPEIEEATRSSINELQQKIVQAEALGQSPAVLTETQASGHDG